MDLRQNPTWACEVTLQPLERFPLDAAIPVFRTSRPSPMRWAWARISVRARPSCQRPVRDRAAIDAPWRARSGAGSALVMDATHHSPRT